jgi:small multidrug resistance family-3 protein
VNGMWWSLVIYAAAAVAEIAGCFAFWAWLRLDLTPLWLIPGIASLILFAFLLTQVDLTLAGRAYAAYGGIYITASVVWLCVIEGQTPDRFDFAGVGFSILGTVIILLAPSLRS